MKIKSLFTGVIVSLLILTPLVMSQVVQDVITDPIVSRRCKSLLKERQKKIRIRQRLNALILRNKKLQSSLRENQKVAKQKLLINKTQLKNNLRLTAIRVQSMEENIVRKGWRGIVL